MNKARIVTALILMTAAAVPTLAQDAAPAPQAEAKPAKPKLICRTDNVTGSRVRIQQTCLSKEDWTRLADKTVDAMNRVGRAAATGWADRPPPGQIQ